MRWGLSLAVSAVGLTFSALLHALSPWASRWALRYTSAASHRLFGLSVSLTGAPPGGFANPPYVFVHLNQTSLIETFLHHWLVPVPTRMVVNVEYSLLPVFGWVNFALGSCVVVRQWRWQSRRALDRAVAQLRRGDSFCIAIEGRRSPDGRLQPYKKGPAVMAIRAGATLVPYLTLGAAERLPYGEWRVRPGDVEVRFLAPVSTAGLTYEDRERVVEALAGTAKEALGAASAN